MAHSALRSSDGRSSYLPKKMPKAGDRYQKGVEEGYQKIIRLYQKIGNCRQKTEGDRLWNELTKSITQFRKTLSKLESYAYEDLLNRFERRNTSSAESWTGTLSSASQEEPPADRPLFDEDDFPAFKEANGEVEPEATVEVEAPLPAENWPEESATRFPLPVFFRIGEIFHVRVLAVISPLEFYVIRKEDLSRLDDVDRVLDASVDELRGNVLPDENCVMDAACAALVGDRLRRAVIRMKGTREVQVYLVDLGRTQFLNRQYVYTLPRSIANMAPPLAHYCSLADADSRHLDQNTVKAFSDRILQQSDVILKAHGTRRKTHGEVVDILQERKKRPGIVWPTRVQPAPPEAFASGDC